MQNTQPPTPKANVHSTSSSKRWWRMVLLSAAIQIVLVAAAWYAVQTRRNSDSHLSTTTVTTITTAPTEIIARQAPTTSVNQAIESATIKPNHSEPNTQTSSTNPSENTTNKTTRPTEHTGAHTALPKAPQNKVQAPPKADTKPTTNASSNAANLASPEAKSVTTLSDNTHVATPPTNSLSNLLNVPIAQQSISYHAQLIDGANTVELPPARLSSTHLGAQRYSISLSNGTSQAGAGTFGWYDTFLMTEHGPNPLEIGGGLYIKSSERPLRAALGLNLHDDGQTWHWGKKANVGTRTHANFLDRTSLIVYIQGALRRNPVKSATQWILPLAGDHAVREVAVQLSSSTTPNEIKYCQPCVQAQVRAHLGEMSYWSVWYDGSHNWKPVMMRMGLGGERVLSLIAQ